MKDLEIIYRYGTGSEKRRSRPIDGDAARKRLEDGNRSFAELLNGVGIDDKRMIHIDASGVFSEGDSQSPRQRPFAAVLGCSDARVPVELVFSEGPNDLFVVRVAGNGVGSEVLGSLRYAVEHLGSIKIVAVLGHSGCGAVSAAVDAFLTPSKYLELATSHALRAIVDRILVVIQASAKRMIETFGVDVTKRAGYRMALIEASIAINAALGAYTLNKEFEGQQLGAIKAVYGVYLVESREVWSPRPGNSTGLTDPPVGAEGFTELGDWVLGSARIRSILGVD